MKIGVICEGPSDFPAFEFFLTEALIDRGLDVEIVRLFPDLDNTLPEAGWGNVLNWLKKNSADFRIQKYFGGGLFGGGLANEVFDALIVHLDADVLADGSFSTFIRREFDIEVVDSQEPSGRAKQLLNILSVACELPSMSNGDRAKHILVPAVDATETWCVAAFNNMQREWEKMRGQDLTNEFMRCLERSESRPFQESYAEADKNRVRRSKFCKQHRGNANRIVATCGQFAQMVDNVSELAAD